MPGIAWLRRPKNANRAGESVNISFEEYARFVKPYTLSHAAKISGCPESWLKQLAELYADPEVRVTSFWTMGFNQHTRGVWANRLCYNLHLFGISLSELYQRLGDRLWRLAPTLYCKLSNPYDRGRPNAQPRLAFVRGGVIALGGIFDDDASFQIGLDVANALRNLRRASPQKQRVPRRADDPVVLERYCQARARLCDLLGPHFRARHAERGFPR